MEIHRLYRRFKKRLRNDIPYNLYRLSTKLKLFGAFILKYGYELYYRPFAALIQGAKCVEGCFLFLFADPPEADRDGEKE